MTTAIPLVGILFVIGLFFGLAVFVFVVIALIRGIGRRDGGAPPRLGASGAVPPLMDDGFTNPANPMYHVHHGSSAASMPHQSPTFESSPQPPSFDAGSLSAPSFDAGSSSPSPDPGGNNCG